MRSAVVLVGVALVGSACGSDSGDGQQPVEAGSLPTLDDRLAAVSARAPGFGGVFRDAQGRLAVYLTPETPRTVAAAAIAEIFPDIAPVEARVLAGAYDFEELLGWQRKAASLLELPSVVFTDIDESTNRLTIAVSAPSAIAPIEKALSALRIPREAVVIELSEPIHFLTTLREQVRPITGGLQLRFSGYLCSLGYNAVRGGVAGFVTASHCSDTQGSADGTLYYQPQDQVTGELIGAETVDPPYQKNLSGCPKGKRCRYSDANFSARAAGVSATLGGIAKTTGANNGSLAIAGGFTIKAKGTSYVGDTLNKVGRTTGWTQGRLSRTCVTTSVSRSNIALICQDFVESKSQIVAGGDSGSNVFAVTSGDEVSLRGSLWGGNSSGTVFVFSPMANVELELGPLTTF